MRGTPQRAALTWHMPRRRTGAALPAKQSWGLSFHRRQPCEASGGGTAAAAAAAAVSRWACATQRGGLAFISSDPAKGFYATVEGVYDTCGQGSDAPSTAATHIAPHRAIPLFLEEMQPFTPGAAGARRAASIRIAKTAGQHQQYGTGCLTQQSGGLNFQ